MKYSDAKKTDSATAKSFNPAEIQILVLDVDGVVTDGTLVINSDGSESKTFNSLDDHGFRLWHRAGLKTAFLSGRFSEPTRQLAKLFEIDYLFQDCHDKLSCLEQLVAQSGVDAANIAYVGDDIPDLPVIKHVGFGVAVANAVDEVKQYADYVTIRPGGSGAVREVVEYILKAAGKWQALMERYQK